VYVLKSLWVTTHVIGILCCLLRLCCCFGIQTLLFRYTDIRDYNSRHRQQCPVLHNIVDKAKTAWGLMDAASADNRLQTMSKKLQQNFQAKLDGRAQATQQDNDQATATIARVGDLVSSFRGMMNNMIEEIAMLRAQVTTLSTAFVQLQGTVQGTNNATADMVRIQEQLATLTSAVVQQNSNAAAPAAVGQATNLAVVLPMVGPEQVSVGDATMNQDLPAAAPLVAHEAPNAFVALMAQQSAISRGIVGIQVNGEKVSDFLIHLYKTNKLIQIHNRPELQLTEMAKYHMSTSEKKQGPTLSGAC
jgi:phage host-nuclease inhibitor protein Gam